MTAVEANAAPPTLATRTANRRSSFPQLVKRALRRNPTVVIGGGLLLFLVLTAILAPVLAPANPTQTGFSTRVRPPAILGYPTTFVFGSDNLGRDVLSRLLYGGQLSLSLAVASVVLSGIVGVAAGLISGYVGGRVDDIIMRIVDVQLAFPVIQVVLIMAAAVFIVINLLVDLMYTVLDPRIRYS